MNKYEKVVNFKFSKEMIMEMLCTALAKHGEQVPVTIPGADENDWPQFENPAELIYDDDDNILLSFTSNDLEDYYSKLKEIKGDDVWNSESETAIPGDCGRDCPFEEEKSKD